MPQLGSSKAYFISMQYNWKIFLSWIQEIVCDNQIDWLISQFNMYFSLSLLHYHGKIQIV